MITTYKSTVTKLPMGMQVMTESRGFKLYMDEPKSMCGTNVAMTPLEALLATLGGCQAIVAAVYAKAQGVTYDRFSVEIEGDIDLEGFKGNEDIKKGFQEIRYRMHFKTNEPKEKMEAFAKFVEHACPITETLMHDVRLISTGVVIE